MMTIRQFIRYECICVVREGGRVRGREREVGGEEGRGRKGEGVRGRGREREEGGEVGRGRGRGRGRKGGVRGRKG